MKSRIAALALVSCFLGGAVICLAQNPSNMGTWTLNQAKSRIAPGSPKYTTVVYAAVGEDVKVTVDGTDGAGNPAHSEWTGKFDGKPYPVTGNPNADTRSYRKISGRVNTFAERKSGKLTAWGLIVLSTDGMSRTVTFNTTDSKGRRIRSTGFYDKRH